MTAAAAKSRQSCLTLCDPIDVSPPGSPIHGFLQARTLKWVAISFSSEWKWKVKSEVAQSLSRVQLFTAPWTIAYQAALSMGFPRQEYWNGLSLPSPFPMTTYILVVVYSILSISHPNIGHVHWRFQCFPVITSVNNLCSFFCISMIIYLWINPKNWKYWITFVFINLYSQL